MDKEKTIEDIYKSQPKFPKGALSNLLWPIYNRRMQRWSKVNEPVLQELRDKERRAKLDALPAGPGLKAYDVNTELYQYDDGYKFRDRGAAIFFDTYSALGMGVDIGSDDPTANVYTQLLFSGLVRSKPTNELIEWIKENTPQKAFFTPEMIMEAVANDERITANTRQQDDMLFWNFSDSEGNSFELSRMVDGVPPSTYSVEPYLGVWYAIEYDTDSKSVVAKPGFGLNSYGHDAALRKDTPLSLAIREDLQLVPTRVEQEIVFHVIKGGPQPYFTGAGGGEENFESFRAGDKILADLPRADGSHGYYGLPPA